MLQAVGAFNRFMGGTPVELAELEEGLLCEWVAWMSLEGYTRSTVRLYLKYLSSLYGKASKSGLVHDNGCFTEVMSKLEEIGEITPDSPLLPCDPDFFPKLRRLVQADYVRSPGLRLAKDVVLFCLYQGGMTFGQIAAYRKDGYTGDDGAVLEIVGRYTKARNKYLFPLRQSSRTAKQLERAVSALFTAALDSVCLSVPSRTDVWLGYEMWACAAHGCGIPAGVISRRISLSGVPGSLIGIAGGSRVTAAAGYAEGDAVRRVSHLLSQDPCRWYAMQFRPHVTYDKVLARLASCPARIIDTYYPMEEIYKRVGKKIVGTGKPLFPGLLFFRAKASEVARLFGAIGDMAWGYRRGRGPGSAYAEISAAELRRCQLAIGSLSPGMEVYPAGTLEPRAGDRLEVIGGEFRGHGATFEKTVNTGGRVIYRLRLIGSNAIEWSVDLPPHLVHPPVTPETLQGVS